MVITDAEVGRWLGSIFWPFVRIGSALSIAPIFSSKMLPMRIRLLLALALTIVITPLLPAAPVVPAISASSFLIIVQQLLIGLTMGFVFSVVMAIFIYAGQIIAMQMGLGFASMIDPVNGVSVPVVSQFYALLVTLIFLTMGGHLQMIQVIFDSFRLMPVSVDNVAMIGVRGLLEWSGILFSGALSVALPVIGSLLVVNMAFGIMARSAPQFNIFAIGFPITMLVGFIIMLITLPNIIDHTGSILDAAVATAGFGPEGNNN